MSSPEEFDAKATKTNVVPEVWKKIAIQVLSDEIGALAGVIVDDVVTSMASMVNLPANVRQKTFLTKLRHELPSFVNSDSMIERIRLKLYSLPQ